MRPLAYSIIIALLPAFIPAANLHADESNISQFVRDSDRDFVGRLLSYERSNQDGSRAERIDVYRASETRLEVMKSAARCTQAALVSAELGFQTWSGDTVTGGALLPGAEVMEFAFLTHDREAGQLNTAVHLPDQTLTFETPTSDGPLHLYDFDLASLTALTPYLVNPQAGLSVNFALMWADPANPSVTMMGEETFVFDGRQPGETGDVLTYAASGALGEGYLWLDAEDGHIVEAAFAEPNHPGYDSFRLRLTGVTDTDAEGWQQHLTAHYEDCGG